MHHYLGFPEAGMSLVFCSYLSGAGAAHLVCANKGVELCCAEILSQTIAHCIHHVIFVHASCWPVQPEPFWKIFWER